MPRVSINVELEIPSNVFIYDIGTETLLCNICKQHNVSFSVMSPPTARQGEKPITSQDVFRDFTKAHADCIVKHRETEAARAARQPCRGDYWKEVNGTRSGPHECSKIDGHYGPCGPS